MKNTAASDSKQITEMLLPRGRKLSFTVPQVMGILNCTPDSFSDGGRYPSVDSAASHALQMIADGATIIDIGGESTRPGSVAVTAEEELRRVIPVIERIRTQSDIPISIDTTKAIVAKAALDAGADIVNDISALKFDNEMLAVVREYQVPIILMHMQGTPQTMQNAPHYNDVIRELITFLQVRIRFCAENGIAQDRIIIDPGIGFGKRLEDNLAILKQLHMFTSLNCPVLVGASRKSFITTMMQTKTSTDTRLGGSIAAAVVAVQNGASIVRAHDVAETVQALRLLESIQDEKA